MKCKAVVIATGTFLKGRITIGKEYFRMPTCTYVSIILMAILRAFLHVRKQSFFSFHGTQLSLPIYKSNFTSCSQQSCLKLYHDHYKTKSLDNLFPLPRLKLNWC